MKVEGGWLVGIEEREGGRRIEVVEEARDGGGASYEPP
jgi:hypothetical protein